MTAQQRIDRFEILERIGQGGMGTVFKAHDPRINRIVAVKLLREGFDTPDMRERFMREARAAGQLRNPHIVTIFELGEFEEQPYIVMEFVEGEPLDRLIKRQAPLSIIRKMELIEALCSGLAYAHRVGIVHRDIKPPNLLVESEGSLKILDFGIARVEDSELTKVGTLIGTPNYMSPEQLHGGALDKRCDIFAVGAVFYELLSFRRAFPGSGPPVVAQILTRDPDSLLDLCPDLDPQLDAIVRKALEKAPEARYGDLIEMRREIVSVRERLQRDESAIRSRGAAPSGPLGTVPTPPSTPASREEVFRRALTEVDAARAEFERGEAAAAISRLERFDPRNELVDEALATLRRRTAALDAMRTASSAAERGDWSAVRDACNRALSLDPGNSPAQELKQHALDAIEQRRAAQAFDARAETAIEAAQRMFDAGEQAAALDALASFSPPHPRVTTAHEELRAEAERIAARIQAEMRAETQHEDAAPHTLLDTLVVPATSLDDAASAEAGVEEFPEPTLARVADLALPQEVELPPAPTAVEYRAPERSLVRPIGMAAAAVAAVGTLLVAAFLMFRDTSKEAVVVAPPQTYPVRIDAVPWAEIRISPVSTTGAQQIDAVTPFFVQLPAGEYRIRFSNPTLQRTAEERVTISAGRDNVVRVVLPETDINAIVEEIMSPKSRR